MIIITNGDKAIMYYTESQWIDAQDADFSAQYSAFKVPNNAINGQNILQSSDISDNVASAVVVSGSDAMSHDTVASLATEIIFEPAS